MLKWVILGGAALVLVVPGLMLGAEEEREGLGVSPTSISIDAAAGETKSGDLVVVNESSNEIGYKLYASSFKIRNESYDKDFDLPAEAGLISPSNWFKLPTGTRQLARAAQQKVSYSVQIPANVAPGGYYGVIFAETVGTKPDATGVARVKRVGALVFIRVEGSTLREAGSITSFNAPTWQQEPPVKASLRISNQGNVHFPLQGRVRLRNLFGGKVSEAPLEGTILPGTTRKFDLSLPSGQNLGLYYLEGEVEFLGQKHSLGKQWLLLASPLWLGLLIGAVIVIIWVLFSARTKKHRR